jgi:hypothetical protein
MPPRGQRSGPGRSISGVGVATDTAIEMQYPMWVMPVSEFIKLTKLEPHQKLRADNRIVQWDKSMKRIFFMSHQWTSFANPDPTAEQLRAMQRIILRMMAGKLPKTSPSFVDAVYLPSTLSVTSRPRSGRGAPARCCVYTRADIASLRGDLHLSA